MGEGNADALSVPKNMGRKGLYKTVDPCWELVL